MSMTELASQPKRRVWESIMQGTVGVSVDTVPTWSEKGVCNQTSITTVNVCFACVQEQGGEMWGFDEKTVIYCDDWVVGSCDDLISWAADKYNYEDFRSGWVVKWFLTSRYPADPLPSTKLLQEKLLEPTLPVRKCVLLLLIKPNSISHNSLLFCRKTLFIWISALERSHQKELSLRWNLNTVFQGWLSIASKAFDHITFSFDNSCDLDGHRCVCSVSSSEICVQKRVPTLCLCALGRKAPLPLARTCHTLTLCCTE